MWFDSVIGKIQQVKIKPEEIFKIKFTLEKPLISEPTDKKPKQKRISHKKNLLHVISSVNKKISNILFVLQKINKTQIPSKPKVSQKLIQGRILLLSYLKF